MIKTSNQIKNLSYDLLHDSIKFTDYNRLKINDIKFWDISLMEWHYDLEKSFDYFNEDQKTQLQNTWDEYYNFVWSTVDRFDDLIDDWYRLNSPHNIEWPHQPVKRSIKEIQQGVHTLLDELQPYRLKLLKALFEVWCDLIDVDFEKYKHLFDINNYKNYETLYVSIKDVWWDLKEIAHQNFKN